MALPELPFETRTYREIVAEAIRRIPVHTPEWNNFNDSDPGVTLLQLFGFMAESVIYRANLVPERNRQKFLRLLGLPMQAAAPARGLVSFVPARGAPPSRASLAADAELSAGSVPFRTGRGLTLLPLECRAYFKKRVDEPRRSEIQATYDRLYASIRRPAQPLAFYETVPMTPPTPGALSPALSLADTVDGCLWLALCAPTAAERENVRLMVAGQVLTLGIVPALDERGKALYPAGAPATQARGRLSFEVPDPSSREARYRALTVLASDDVLAEPGTVDVRLPELARLGTWDALVPLQVGVGAFPPALDSAEEQARLVTWIRVRAQDGQSGQPLSASAEPAAAEATDQLRVVLSWAGVNAARVVQRARVEGERLPDGDGEPDQRAVLANTPVIAEGLSLTVNGEPWQRVDDLASAAPEVSVRAPRHAVLGAADPAVDVSPAGSKVFTLDPATGEIRFGDGARGMRPPLGALVLCSYDYGGGTRGLVGVGSIQRGTALPSGYGVTNPVPPWGASDGETVAQAERRMTALLRHRDVLSSKQDYLDIVRSAPGVHLGRAEVLSLVHPDAPQQASEGVVTLIVIPAFDPRDQDAPRPDRAFLDTLCAYLEPRRILTTELHVRGPSYRDVIVSAGIQGIPGEAEGPLSERVRGALRDFLSPLHGGFSGAGWPLAKTVEAAELLAAATRVPGVAKVTGLSLSDADGSALPNGLTLGPLELPRATVRVAIGAPPSDGPAQPGGGEAPLPVPVIPAEC